MARFLNSMVRRRSTRMSMRMTLGLSALVALLSCTRSKTTEASLPPAHTKLVSVTPDRVNRTEYAMVNQGVHRSMDLLDLCKLARMPMWAGAGFYRVTALTGYTEATTEPDSPTGFTAVTYVELELVEAWSPVAPKKPVARISGGPGTNGTNALWHVRLQVDEELGVLLGLPRKDNLGFYDLHPLGLFQRRSGGGYTNEQLFTQRRVQRGELSELIRGAWANGKPCARDEKADYGVTPRPAGTAEDVVTQEVPAKRASLVEGGDEL